jgi:hypothetical protein
MSQPAGRYPGSHRQVMEFSVAFGRGSSPAGSIDIRAAALPGPFPSYIQADSLPPTTELRAIGASLD